MKYLLSLIFVLVIGSTTVCAETYEIISLNTPTITIGGKLLKKGGRFKDTSNIKWVDGHQSMEVKSLSTGVLHRFSRKTFESKGNVLSIADYFLRTKKGSSRDISDRIPFKRNAASSSFPEKRIALIIGNSNYDNLSYLRNAQKDAADISIALEKLGFDIFEVYECTYPEMKTALNNFASKAKNYDVALFYYAGHGLQQDGRNFLIPIERALEMKSELHECLDCEDILSKIDESGVPVRISFFDACRNVKRSWSRASDIGLARMEGAIGSVIVFATQSGKIAEDGEGDNSPFAKSLIKNIKMEDVPFHETMVNLVRDTYELTNHRQVPLSIGTLLTDFRFLPKFISTTKQPTATPSNSATTLAYYDGESPDSLYTKGKMYLILDENKTAFEYFKAAAEKGHAESELYLGYFYSTGNGVTKDYALALEHYEKAAKQGIVEATTSLGVLYYNGLGVKQNYITAFNYFKKAADKNNTDAQKYLGKMYYSGLGTKKDYITAFNYFKKAADKNDLDAQYQLGYMYLNGDIGAKNYTEAQKWFLKAALNGSSPAQFALGVMYYQEIYGMKNYAEALNWFQKAANQNNGTAYYYLGLMNEYGNGVAKNKEEAKRLYSKASSLGDLDAQKALKLIDKRILKGTVVDSDGEPFIGATIFVKNLSRAISTNIDGEFILEDLPEGSTIEISYIGFKTLQLSYPKDFPSNNVVITLSK